VLAFSVAEAFAGGTRKEAALERPRVAKPCARAWVFGTNEAITPRHGWGAGLAASEL